MNRPFLLSLLSHCQESCHFSGAADLKGAPIPDFPGIAYNYGNNAQGYQQVASAYQAVGTVKGIGLLGVSRRSGECGFGEGAMGDLEGNAALRNTISATLGGRPAQECKQSRAPDLHNVK